MKWMTNTYIPRWDLDVIFPGGSDSQEFRKYLNDVDKEMNELKQIVENFTPTNEVKDQNELIVIVKELERVMKKYREASAYISCLSAQNVKDEQADMLVGERSELGAKFGGIQTTFTQKLVLLNDETWETLLKEEDITELTFVLNEFRDKAKELLSADQEILINDLSIDGYQGWGQMYDAIVGNMTVDLEEDGETRTYSVGQAANKLTDPDRQVRKKTFEKLEAAWEDKSALFGQTLNHLAGFRLQTYKHRGWNEVLKEPLEINRMKQETLDAMWGAISANKEPFISFLQKKADLLGMDKLSIYDVEAPLTKTVDTLSYTDGADFIIKHFKEFSPKMANFAQMAFEKQWIEAEDRSGKRPGGFCKIGRAHV